VVASELGSQDAPVISDERLTSAWLPEQLSTEARAALGSVAGRHLDAERDRFVQRMSWVLARRLGTQEFGRPPSVDEARSLGDARLPAFVESVGPSCTPNVTITPSETVDGLKNWTNFLWANPSSEEFALASGLEPSVTWTEWGLAEYGLLGVAAGGGAWGGHHLPFVSATSAAPIVAATGSRAELWALLPVHPPGDSSLRATAMAAVVLGESTGSSDYYALAPTSAALSGVGVSGTVSLTLIVRARSQSLRPRTFFSPVRRAIKTGTSSYGS
jgi:hypothetical protein